MTKLGFITDIHLGNHKRQGGAVTSSLNVRCRQTLDALAAAVDAAANEECDALYVLGDLFDTHSPSPQLLAETMRALQAFPMAVHVLVGNHDQVSTQVEDHALAPLALGVDNVFVAESPRATNYGSKRKATTVLEVPFRPGRSTDWLPDVLEEYAVNFPKGPNVLAVHMGISDDETAKYLRGAHDSIEATDLAALCREFGIDFVFAGNWHDRKQWGIGWPQEGKAKNKTLRIVQVGALVPTGWDNPGVEGYGGLAILDGENVRFIDIPGPRFIKGEECSLDSIPEGCTRYYAQTFDDVDVKAAARDAAQAARSSETLDEALANFVEKMPLDDDIDRKRVLATSKGYLAG